MELEDADACWSAVKDVVWAEDKILGGVKNEAALHNTFSAFGGMVYASPKSLWPLTFVCINSDCPYVKNGKALKLQTTVEHNTILYTLSMGPVPVRTHHTTCEGCGVVYHPDYFVKTMSTNERLRHYYDSKELPEIIQVATHHFIETKLAKIWTNSMLYGWCIKMNSASNCARVYERTFVVDKAVPDDWTVQANIQPEFVYDAFKILALLQYHQRRNTQLCVPQECDQANRFDDEMERINQEIYEHGQPEIDHRCEKCVRTLINKQDDVCEVFAVVCDGVTVGRPCCGVPHCEGRLLSTRDAFCEKHLGCDRPVKSKNSKACDLLEHQALEDQYHETEKAAFQLKLRYERSQKANTNWDKGEEILDTSNGNSALEASIPTGKGKKKTAKIRAQFGRRRTHNEQLIIAPCGMILARQTFYHSEVFSAVAKFVKHTFQHRRKPNHFIFDWTNPDVMCSIV
ncbi:hypothetical protein K435DRAFT_804952 [Dendrothele bispora CBS 962.96]|uniref:CxC6 like cysteine cluster associated with KDZ domain-containing protein n=1 Tax=Dendrothele bispora (strain CBS 962.96) TaxID=1314807 RepID=A0A4S8LDC0_DENBC|nr:hypothetical protein K435DRAFT_804952 [Dendrothele bispora CBS 962.96]